MHYLRLSSFRRTLAGAGLGLASLLSAAPAAQAQGLIGTYTFTGAIGDEATFPVDAQPTNAVFAPFGRGSGITPSTSANRFSATGFTQATTVDLNQYYNFSITANGGFVVDVDSLTFTERRSGTGITKYQVRSSVDNFAAPLVDVTVPDDTNIRPAKLALPGAPFNSLSTIEFRIYGYAAEATAGTWRMDDVRLVGRVLTSGPATPTFSFAPATRTVAENAGTIQIPVTLTNPGTTAATVNVALATPAGTATAATDYTFTTPQTLTFAPGTTTQNATLTVIDDTQQEPSETVILQLTAPSTGATVGAGTFTLTLTDNDGGPGPLTPPLTTIAAVNVNDATGAPVLNGQAVRVRGVVTGPNIRMTGYQTSLQNAGKGIGLFKSANIGTQTIAQGDSLEVIGVVGQFNGLTQITIDSFRTRAVAQRLPAPRPTTVLDEVSESLLTRLTGGPFTLVDATQWTNTGSGFTVDITNGTTTYAMRIVRGTDVYGSPAPTQPFNLVGIGGQFDNAAPFDSGYQIIPRSLADIQFGPLTPTLAFTTPTRTVAENAGTIQIPVTLTNPGTTAVTVNVALGTPAGTATAATDYTFTTPQTLTFAPGTTTQNATLTVIDDTQQEPSENVLLQLTAPSTGATIGAGRAFALTITDNDTPPPAASVQFSLVSQSVAENAGSVQIPVTLTNATTTAVTVEVMRSGGTATAGTDFTFATQTLTFAPGTTTQNAVLNLIDDTQQESAETVILMLMSPTGGAVLGATSTFTLTITDNDSGPGPLTPPLTTIAAVNVNDATGAPVLAGQAVRVRGVVTGPNIRMTGYQTSLQSAGKGIGLFKSANIGTQTIAQGDSLEVIGVVGQFNGLTQIAIDSFRTRAVAQRLPAPRPTTVLDEMSESLLTRLTGGPFTLADATQWTNAGSGFTVDITNGTTTYALRIVRGTDVYGSPAPTQPFNLVGIGGQFDNAAPFDSGYQIIPRSLADIQIVNGLSADAATAALVLYPNPATDQLTISGTAGGTATVLDALGRPVLTAKLPAAGTATVRVSALPAGVYVVRVGTASRRFLKQ